MTGYKDRISPSRAILIGFGTWSVLLAIAPVDPRWGSSPAGILTIFSGVAALFFGIAVPHLLRMHFRPMRFSEGAATTVIWVCALLGLIGFALKLVDLTYFRSVDFATQNAIDARKQISLSEGSNMVSILAVAFMPFGLAALVMAFFAKTAGVLKRVPLLIWIAALAPTLPALAMLSRSVLMTAALFVFVSWVNLAKQISARYAALTTVVGLALGHLFASLMVARLDQFGTDVVSSQLYSVYSYCVPLNSWAWENLGSDNSSRTLMLGYYSVLQYFLSGFFEFILLIDMKDSNFAYGDYTFFILPKIMKFLSSDGAGGIYSNAELFNPRPGVFQSFFGPLYIDFGDFFVIPCVIFGFVAEMLRLHVRQGNMMAFPAYVLMVSQLLLSPSFPTLLMNAAIMTNFTFLVLYLASRWMGKT